MNYIFETTSMTPFRFIVSSLLPLLSISIYYESQNGAELQVNSSSHS